MLACADAVEINGIYYNLISKAKIAEVIQHPDHPKGYKGEINIPDEVSYDESTYKVTSIGEDAFSGSEITSVKIGDNVATIGKYAFMSCKKLTSVKMGNSVETIYQQAFSYTESLTSITLPNSMRTLDFSAFAFANGLVTIELNEGLETIGNMAFEDCENLESIEIPNSVTMIGNYVEVYDMYASNSFWRCKNLTSVTFGNGITALGSQMFEDCTSLESVIIPVNIIKIEQLCFQGCSKLSSVAILGDVTFIGEGSFERCKELGDVYCYAADVPALGTDVFKDSYVEYATLHVPESLISKYKATAQWKDFGNIVALKEGDPGYGDEQPDNPKPGDMNADGEVNGTDLVMLAKQILEGTADVKAADLNGDGVVNGTDLVKLVNMILGKE